MRSIVIDASAIAEYLLRTTSAHRYAAAIEDQHVLLHVPALCDVELTAVLRRALLDGRASEARASEAVRDYMDLPLTRHGHVSLMERALRLRNNFSAYDATYIALAEALDATFLTGDRPLARAVGEHTSLAVLPTADA